jgi:ATPase family protein associated with various cellular activities (AAA)
MTLEFKVFVTELKELLKRTGDKNQKVQQEIRYQNDDKRVTIPVDHLLPEELRKLAEILDEKLKKFPLDKRVRDNRWTRNRIQAYFELHDGAVDDKRLIKTVEALTIALKRFLELNAPHRWVFEEGQDKITLPYLVTGISYTKRKRTRDDGVIPARVSLSAVAYRNGEKISASASWSEDEYRPMTVTQALFNEGLIVETPEAVKSYLASLEVYARYQDACGQQTYAVGDGYSASEDRWGYSRFSTTPMVRDGQPTRVVLDPLTEELKQNQGDDESRVYSTKFWDEVPDRNGLELIKTEVDPDEDEFLDDDNKPLDTIEVMLPLHPYLYVFDLDKHTWVRINAINLQEYPWDKELINKLILPEAQKGLLGVLMSTTGENVGDIVRGKMSGVIVLATGAPGVGKTLTAEVFSEHIEKPLYSVQCSQLGLDVSSIESNLQTILSRASRWGAVLLIDEADVYVRRRGEDIQQNAIVGVFLRLLEYHRGVLFMTSNQETIDDAILSRATAWIRYELPDKKLLALIWRVLAKQYKVNLTDGHINLLVDRLPVLSGRSVRNILKLATMLKGTRATTDDIIGVSRYQALEGESQDKRLGAAS